MGKKRSRSSTEDYRNRTKKEKFDSRDTTTISGDYRKSLKSTSSASSDGLHTAAIEQ